MVSKQNIERPHGVTAFGSHVMRVRPDLALVSLGINRLAAEPADAFTAAREGARSVRAHLSELGVPDGEVRSSQIKLETRYRRANGESKFIGHAATVEFNVALSDLNQLEQVLVGAVEAGADQIKSVRFKTRQLRDLRAQARRKAVDAARAKAELYAEAAGITLGKVLHIEDVDPTTMGRREYSHVVDQAQLGDDAGEPGAYDPGTIAVSGSVVISYAIL